MTSTSKFLLVALCLSLAALVFCGVQRIGSRQTPYIDMPEDPPAAGDLLRVERVTPDSVIIGYANPQGMQLIHGR